MEELDQLREGIQTQSLETDGQNLTERRMARTL